MADGGRADAGGGLTCENYCTLIEANCTGANDQFASMQNCLDTCESYPRGMLTDTMGNTLGCRIYHSMAAASDPGTHCGHAGPLGGGECGEPCESFCTIAMGQCPMAYASMDACMTACAGYRAGMYNTMATSGNTLACRMYHLTVAATDPAGHCGHIGVDSPTCMGRR
jgi:hypothetical protein